jgi:hypothetical protein
MLPYGQVPGRIVSDHEERSMQASEHDRSVAELTRKVQRDDSATIQLKVNPTSHARIRECGGTAKTPAKVAESVVSLCQLRVRITSLSRRIKRRRSLA